MTGRKKGLARLILFSQNPPHRVITNNRAIYKIVIATKEYLISRLGSEKIWRISQGFRKLKHHLNREGKLKLLSLKTTLKSKRFAEIFIKIFWFPFCISLL